MKSSIGGPPFALCFSMARQTGASFTNCGRAPTMLTIFMASVASACASGIKPFDRVHHVLQLLLAQLGVDRNRERFPRGALALRTVAFLAAEVREALLHVQWHRIVDLGADARLAEVRLELVALG